MRNKYFDFETEDYSALSTSQLKRMADYWLRKYLLKLSKRNGYNQIYCPVAKEYYNESNMHVSHYIDRSNNCTRYDLDNVRLVNKFSNTWDAQEMIEGYKSKHHKEFEEVLREEIGSESFVKLLEKSKELRIFAREDIIEIITNFRKNVG